MCPVCWISGFIAALFGAKGCISENAKSVVRLGLV